MRDWTPPARLLGPKVPPAKAVGQRHHECMAAFFMIAGVSVFIVALLCALGFINLLA